MPSLTRLVAPAMAAEHGPPFEDRFALAQHQMIRDPDGVVAELFRFAAERKGGGGSIRRIRACGRAAGRDRRRSECRRRIDRFDTWPISGSAMGGWSKW